MSVRSAQSITVLFTTRVFSTGVGTNADSLPTGTLYVNGVSNAATVTVANLSAGLYTAQVTLPTLAIGDEVELVIAATVSSISDKAVIWGDTKDILLDSSGDVTFSNTSIATVTSLTNSVTVGAYSAGFDIATRRGTAQAGATGSITLDSGASATDHLYERLQVAILSGTGAGQSGRIITGYVGSTKVATTTPNWTTAPDSTSVFALLPAAADVETILNVASFGQAGYVGIDWGHVVNPTSTVVLANSTIGLVGDLTSTMKTSVQTAADAAITANTTIVEINADVDELITTLGTPLTSAQIATAVWTDTNAADFIVALSIGKSIMNGVSLGTGLTINAYTGDTPQTGDSFARIGAAGAGLTAILTTAMTESYAAKGATMTAAQALYLLQAWLTNLKISGTTYTAVKLDGSTTAATGTLDSSTTPTQNLRAT